MHAMPRPEERFKEADRIVITEHQEGVITTAQALAFGMTPGDIRWKVQSGRWQGVYRGVYATFSGKLTRDAQLWAAVLRAGDGAALSHETAAERHDLAAGPSGKIHVTVPAASDPARWSDLRGVVVHRSTHWQGFADPMYILPVTPVATTVLDLVDAAETLDDAYGWLSRAISKSRTTPGLLVAAFAERKKFTRRRWLNDALADVSDGVTFPLERRWVYDVERPHGLPPATRQPARHLYEPHKVAVKLDGRAFPAPRPIHPPEELARDRRRSNETRIAADTDTLRYGFREVANHPCDQAEQLARALIKHGWDARKLKPCKRPDCLVAGLVKKLRAEGGASLTP